MSVTLATIEKAGRKADEEAIAAAQSSYLAKYGIHNPWQAWLMRQDSRLNELTQGEISGWKEIDE